jgi:hypothetical protein
MGIKGFLINLIACLYPTWLNPLTDECQYDNVTKLEGGKKKPSKKPVEVDFECFPTLEGYPPRVG